MPPRSRTAMTKLNAKASITNRIITLFCNFAGRSVFIKHLSTEFLGVGGMFGNVFSILSLCELGFGEAASQALYKPLAENNMNKVHGIVRYYTVVYRYIALVTLALSMAIMPYLTEFFPDIVKIGNYNAIYLLFVFHQIMSYHFAPKRSLVMSDQRMYIIMNTRTVSSVIVTVSQIAWLSVTGNYFGYLFLRIFFQTIDGITVSIYANKKYGFKTSSKYAAIASEQKTSIKQNTAALALHRIGGVINNSTDSILLSSVLGLSHMGVFSNYSLIVNSIGSFIALAVSSASASVGNLGAEANPEKGERILSKLCFANFFLLTNCTAVLMCVINPVITLWIGRDMCFSALETAVIIACFYVSYIRDPVQIFLHNYGVFQSTRFIPLARGLMNLVLSYIFVYRFGVAGVFAGTLISTLVVPFFLEPYMLFKYGFGKDCGAFVKKYAGYIVTSAVACIMSFMASSIASASGITEIILKGSIAIAVTNILLLIMYGGNKEFHELISIVHGKLKLKKLVSYKKKNSSE